MSFIEYMVIDDQTHAIELREMTETMAENLSEIATVVSVNFLGGRTTVWRNRIAHVESIDEGTLMELKRRIIWREKHAGMLS